MYIICRNLALGQTLTIFLPSDLIMTCPYSNIAHPNHKFSLGQKRSQQKFALKSKKNENLKIQKAEVIGVRHTQLIS